jgi:hypothetical protein
LPAVAALAAKVGAISLALVGLSAVAASAAKADANAAHHSVLPFDGVTKTTIEGTVARLLWQNPHTFVAVDVGAHRWTIESEGASILQRLGWTSESLTVGDAVTVTGARARDGRRLMRCHTIKTHARELPCFGSPS